MTFTLLGRDPSSGELGVAIATYSLAVGGTCPQMLPGLGVATSQASTNPAIGEELMELLEDGVTPVEAFMQALANDEHPEFRQVALLTPTGEPMVHSGSNIKPVSGHAFGENCVAVGNFLANDEVLTAMVSGFENASTGTGLGSALVSRLLSALEAGRAAGGQSGIDDVALPERSACLLVGSPGDRFPIDVRVDSSADAISDLRSAVESYLPMHEYYLKRADDPRNLPTQSEWEQGVR